jgi:putative transposase
MGVHMSNDQASRMCRGLDEHVQAFRERPLEGRYRYVWLDGKIEKVRERGGVRQKCLVIGSAIGQVRARPGNAARCTSSEPCSGTAQRANSR